MATTLMAQPTSARTSVCCWRGSLLLIMALIAMVALTVTFNSGYLSSARRTLRRHHNQTSLPTPLPTPPPKPTPQVMNSSWEPTGLAQAAGGLVSASSAEIREIRDRVSKRVPLRDFVCAEDEIRNDGACQVKCTDHSCSKVQNLLAKYEGSRAFYNCNCPPFTGCWATLKLGGSKASEDSVELPACEASCDIQLGFTGLKWLNDSSFTDLCQGGSGSVTIFPGAFMSLQNMVVNFKRLPHSCNMRKFPAGTFYTQCQAYRGTPSMLHTPRSKAMWEGFQAVKEPMVQNVSYDNYEATPTIIVARDDMGNAWHSLADFWQVFRAIKLFHFAPGGSQILVMDVRIQCSNPCRPDCMQGPFDLTWEALSGRKVITADSMPKQRTLYRHAIISPDANNIIWDGFGRASECSSSVMMDAYRYRVIGHFGLLNEPMPPHPVLTLCSRRAPTMGKAKLTRIIANEDELLKALEDWLPEFIVQRVDFAKLTFKDQVKTMRTTSILVGMHGAGLTNVIWMPVESVLLEIFQYNDLRGVGYRNLAKWSKASYLGWMNREQHRETAQGTLVNLDELKPLIDSAEKQVANFGTNWLSLGPKKINKAPRGVRTQTNTTG